MSSAIYRVAELSDGWNGTIISTQVYFSKFSFCVNKAKRSNFSPLDVLDGAMIVLAIYTLNFFHPGFLLRETPTERTAYYPMASRSNNASREPMV